MSHTPEVENKDNERDKFTTAMLKHAAKVLDVNYLGDTPDVPVSVPVNEIERVKTEIRSRERVFGVNDASLIPLLIKAGDLAGSRDASLRCYQQTYDVLEANHSGAEQSTVLGDVCIAGYADLGMRLFHHGQYNMAETMFSAAASLSRERAKKRTAGVSFAPSASCHLHGVLRDWQDGARAVRDDLSARFDVLRTDTPRRDGASQTEPLVPTDARDTSRPMPSALATPPAPAPAPAPAPPAHGLRHACDLEKLVAYVFDETNVRESLETILLARERYLEAAVASGPLASHLTDLQKSVDLADAEVDPA